MTTSHESGNEGAFRRNGGGWDLKRIIEQSMPVVVTGLLVFFGNSMVTNYKVDALATQIQKLETERLQMQAQMNNASDRLIGLSAQVTAYLGQQTQMNASMDARLTYIERAMRTGNGR